MTRPAPTYWMTVAAKTRIVWVGPRKKPHLYYGEPAVLNGAEGKFLWADDDYDPPRLWVKFGSREFSASARHVPPSHDWWAAYEPPRQRRH